MKEERRQGDECGARETRKQKKKKGKETGIAKHTLVKNVMQLRRMETMRTRQLPAAQEAHNPGRHKAEATSQKGGARKAKGEARKGGRQEADMRVEARTEPLRCACRSTLGRARHSGR